MYRLEIEGEFHVPDFDLCETVRRIEALLHTKGFSGTFRVPECDKCDGRPDAHQHDPYSSPCEPDEERCVANHHRYVFPVTHELQVAEVRP